MLTMRCTASSTVPGAVAGDSTAVSARLMVAYKGTPAVMPKYRSGMCIIQRRDTLRCLHLATWLKHLLS